MAEAASVTLTRVIPAVFSVMAARSVSMSETQVESAVNVEHETQADSDEPAVPPFGTESDAWHVHMNHASKRFVSPSWARGNVEAGGNVNCEHEPACRIMSLEHPHVRKQLWQNPRGTPSSTRASSPQICGSWNACTRVAVIVLSQDSRVYPRFLKLHRLSKGDAPKATTSLCGTKLEMKGLLTADQVPSF